MAHSAPVFRVASGHKEKKTQPDVLRRIANLPPGARQNWDEVLSKYTATVDFPGCAAWRELLQASPHAKVLLTLHPKARPRRVQEKHRGNGKGRLCRSFRRRRRGSGRDRRRRLAVGVVFRPGSGDVRDCPAIPRYRADAQFGSLISRIISLFHRTGNSPGSCSNPSFLRSVFHRGGPKNEIL